MPKLSYRPILLAQDGFTSSATQQHPLGAIGVTKDGRQFRYCQAGSGADLVAGNCIQGPAVIPDHLARTAAVTLAGAQSTVFTPAATGGAANLYAEGYLGVDTAPNLGATYMVKDHAAITASVAFTVNLDLEDSVLVAWSTASRINLIHNPYKNVIQMPVTTATGLLVGVAQYIITASQFGWLLVKGIGSVLIAGTPALGAGVMAPGAVAGAAEIITTTNLVVGQYVGRMAQIGVAGKANFVMVTID